MNHSGQSLRFSNTFLALLILFGAFTFRLWNLGAQSLWHDEAWSIFSAYHPLAWGALGTDPNAPPVFYLSLGAWMQFVGDGVWSLRLWSVLLGLLTVAFVAFVARRWFGDRVALVAGFFAALNPILWVFSQEIRGYVLMPLYALILLWLLHAVLKTGSRRVWLWLLVVEGLMLYTQNLAVPTVAWLNVAAVAALVINRHWLRLRSWLIAQALLGVVYLPWLLTQRPTGTPLNTLPPLDLSLPWNIWQSYFSGNRALVNADSLLMALTALFGVVALIAGVRAMIVWREQQAWLLLSQVLILPVFETAILYAARIDFHPRYFIVSVPATLILIAAGVAGRLSSPFSAGKEEEKNRSPLRTGNALLSGLAAGLVIMITVRMAGVTFSDSRYQHDDFRSIAARYAELGPDDAILIPYAWDPTLDYYQEKLNIRARIIGIPLYSSVETVIETLTAALPTIKRAEFLTWYQLPADVRGLYPCLLSSFGDSTDSFTVQGLKTDRYEQFTLPARFTPSQTRLVNDGGALKPDSEGMPASFWGSRRACLLTRWRKQAANAPGENMRLALRMTPAASWQVYASDVALLNDRQLPTRRWLVGDIVTVATGIDVPAGYGGPGYQLSARLYGDPSQSVVWQAEYVINTLTNPPTRPVEPEKALLSLRDGLYLGAVAFNVMEPIPQGAMIPMRFEWWKQPGAAQDVTVRFEGDTRSELIFQIDHTVQTTWAAARVSPNPNMKGEVRVFVNEMLIKTLSIAGYDRASALPTGVAEATIQPEYPLLARLIVYQAPETVRGGQPFGVTLYWRSLAESTSDQIAFVHLLDSAGNVIAQSDSIPAQGARPFPGWLPGEIVTDTHTLTWNRAYTGPATIEIGLYAPETFARTLLTDGTDHAVLNLAIAVK